MWYVLYYRSNHSKQHYKDNCAISIDLYTPITPHHKRRQPLTDWADTSHFGSPNSHFSFVRNAFFYPFGTPLPHFILNVGNPRPSRHHVGVRLVHLYVSSSIVTPTPDTERHKVVKAGLLMAYLIQKLSVCVKKSACDACMFERNVQFPNGRPYALVTFFFSYWSQQS